MLDHVGGVTSSDSHLVPSAYAWRKDRLVFDKCVRDDDCIRSKAAHRAINTSELPEFHAHLLYLYHSAGYR